MLRNLIEWIERRQPRLARRLGDRLDLQVPAIVASVVTHLVLLGMLGMVGYAANSVRVREFRTEVVDTSLEEFTRLDTTAVLETDKETSLEPVAAAFGARLSPLISEAPPAVAQASKAPELTKVNLSMTAGMALPMATTLATSVTVKGTGSEHVGNVEGAVDRIAIEVLRQLERGRTLVVWAFDASGSLQSERERLSKHIDQVYAHIAQKDEAKLAEHGALLTAVVAFGKERKLMTPEPTEDRAAIVKAIRGVPLDESGEETTFATVADIVRRWGRFKKDGEPYRTMVIVVTDEVGDDEGRLEDAIATAVAAKVPVYVLGSPALFGRVDGYMNYTDPKTKQVFYNLPVRQGPESVVPEGIRLPFWYDGPQYDFMDAGFGPYALSRLAGATGGIYFVTRMGNNRVTFDPAGMREYRPDWVSKSQYEAAVDPKRSPIRWAVIMASRVCQQNLPGQPGLNFPAATDGPDFKQAMQRNQDIVARVEYTVNQALEPITAVAKKRDHETSRRWQAHYDLIRGRLLAMKLRCHEYNMACAKMQKDPKKFSDPASNSWRLVPTEEIASGDKAAAVAEEARSLLKRVVTSHPGTPWALLAQRELKDPFGFKWVEAKVPPPPKRDPNAEAARKKAKKPEMSKPAATPKL